MSSTTSRERCPAPSSASAVPDAPAARPVFTVKELADRWGVNAKTIREAIAMKQLPAFRVGQRRLLIPAAAVTRFEQGCDVPKGHD